MNCIDDFFCQGRVRLALLSLVSVMTLAIGNADALAREPAWCKEFLLCDIVAEGTVDEVRIRTESLRDTWPMKVPGSSDMMIRVAEVTLRVSDTLKGSWSEPTIRFIVYVDSSVFKTNYSKGERMVVGLVWSDALLGGMYRLWADQARLVWQGNEWVQQLGGKILPDLEELQGVLIGVAPRRVLAEEEIVAVGRLVGVSSLRKYDEAGNEYVLKQMQFTNVRLLPGAGSALPGDITVSMVRSGDYWPAWRLVSSHARVLKEGRDYCVAIRNTEEGYVIPHGRDGIFEVRNDELFSVTGSRVGVSTTSVANKRSEEQ